MKLLLLVSFLACAAGFFSDTLLHNVFTLVDKDADGAITVNELLAYFDSTDENGDGKLSEHEYNISPYPPPQFTMHSFFTYYDTQLGAKAADGFVDRSDMNVFFAKMDTNGDGRVTQQEFNAGFSAITPHILGMAIGK